ncbi:hypothetical protein RJ640_005026 [Escallonia rubra]|uniref:At4g15545-like C-terminal domain-containing protein n=1 Tax=Escallonia rubra TaxID=112253 RepID=A0AA88QWK9_9ASTE|nr:hypothetical protein RJ640_005026 [Escallonia rubra]
MSQSSTQSSGSGPDFHLPDEILSVIPTDPYDQLDLARKITSMAIASRVSKLETEVARLRLKSHDKDRAIAQLEEKMKLSKERDSLSMVTKKLGRDLSKLETFKRQLMQSLNDDDSSQAETVDIGTCDQSVPKSYLAKEVGANSYTTQYSLSGPAESRITYDDGTSSSWFFCFWFSISYCICLLVSFHNVIFALSWTGSKPTGHRFSITPYITPRLTPTGTPKIISTNVSPGRYSAAGSPQKTSGMTSPMKAQYEGRTALSSWYSSSQQSSAASSPPHGRPFPGMTVRERSQLSFEQFSAFLANIKELNAQKQSREETLRKAEEIFGTDNKDLYLSFQGLLNRNIH